MQPDEFSVLYQFLASYKEEAGGRAVKASARLTPEQEASLALLAKGKIIDDAERDRWVRIMNENPAALEFFASHAKLN